jgi:adenine-specific DNA methylase
MRTNQHSRLQLSLFEGDWSPYAPPTITRPIHYLGSKLRIIDQICGLIDRLDPSCGPVCDLFAGSGTVSKALSLKRDVIAVDIQEYSRVICSAVLNPAEYDLDSVEDFVRGVASSDHLKALSWALEPLVKFEENCMSIASKADLEPLCDLMENGSLIAFEYSACHTTNSLLLTAMNDVESRLREVQLIDSPSSLVTRYFGGVYFAYTQACQLDVLLEAVANLPQGQRDTYLAAILSTASEIVNTIGKQFAQPLRPRSSSGQPKADLFELVSRDRSSKVMDLYENWLKRYVTVPKTGRSHMAIRQDYREALNSLKGKVKIVYADPPYTRDHYSRYYHVLETLCLRDNPRISTVRINGQDCISRGIYRIERHQSPFCIRSKAPKAFADLFAGVRALEVPLVLSYSPYEKDDHSRPRLMKIEQIEELARTYFRRVEMHRAGRISHSKLTSSEKTVGISYNAEILFICEP